MCIVKDAQKYTVKSCCWKFMILAIKCWEIKEAGKFHFKQIVNASAIIRVRPITVILSESEFKFLRSWEIAVAYRAAA